MRRPGGLWRHRDFLALWGAETISQFGSQVTFLALPLVAILVLEESTFRVAALTTVGFLPFLLFTLPAGVWVDRLRRRPILIGGDLVRALALATIPIAYWLDALTIWQLYAVGFVHGIGTVFFDLAYQSYLPSLVGREQVVEGNSKLELSRAAANIAGPGMAGGLVAALTAPVAILVDAVSFLVSAVLLGVIRTQEEAPAARGAAVDAGRAARRAAVRVHPPVPARHGRGRRALELLLPTSSSRSCSSTRCGSSASPPARSGSCCRSAVSARSPPR